MMTQLMLSAYRCFKVRDFNYNYIPEQFLPLLSNMYPLSHVQLYDPSMLTQFCSQPPLTV